MSTCTRDFDQIWLDYQHEVGLRHHRAKKNRADGAHGVVRHSPTAGSSPSSTHSPRPSGPCWKAEASSDEPDAMLQARTKAFVLQVSLYSRT
jgi:hypothetical protein